LEIDILFLKSAENLPVAFHSMKTLLNMTLMAFLTRPLPGLSTLNSCPHSLTLNPSIRAIGNAFHFLTCAAPLSSFFAYAIHSTWNTIFLLLL
jgi:hypothetical protein